MRFCFSGAFSPVGDLGALARAGDAAGWDTMTIPDHLINPVETRSTYPYTADGGRRWEMGTEWPDPWITIAHLAGMTERLRFLTTVYILPARTPVHVAKQVGTAAALSGNRVEVFGGLRTSPGATAVISSKRPGGRYTELRRVQLNSAGYFRFVQKVSGASRRTYKVSIGGFSRTKRAARR